MMLCWLKCVIFKSCCRFMCMIWRILRWNQWMIPLWKRIWNLGHVMCWPNIWVRMWAHCRLPIFEKSLNSTMAGWGARRGARVRREVRLEKIARARANNCVFWFLVFFRYPAVFFENTSLMYFKKLYKIKRIRFGFLVFFLDTRQGIFKKLNILQKNIQLYKMKNTQLHKWYFIQKK